MGNPISVGTEPSDYLPALVATDDSEVAVTLNKDKTYTLWHTGLDATGVGATETKPVYLAFNEKVAAATTAASANKGVLVNGQELQIGPGISEVSFITAAASDEAVVMIIPHTVLQRRW